MKYNVNKNLRTYREEKTFTAKHKRNSNTLLEANINFYFVLLLQAVLYIEH